jgi:hypothetical protein
MNLDEIKSILQLMEANKLVEFEYEDDGRRLKLRRAEDRIVTAAVPKDVLFKIFSGLTSGLSNEQLQPFISNMHLALWVLAAISLLGAFISLLRPKHVHVEVEDVILQEAA